MKNYMGHFGEVDSPQSILSKISSIELSIAENNLTLQNLNNEKTKIEAEVLSLSKIVETNNARIAFLEKKAKDSYSSFLINIKNINISSW
jgi:hypothetical protein